MDNKKINMALRHLANVRNAQKKYVGKRSTLFILKETYAELKELKGELTYNQFIDKLIEIYKIIHKSCE